MLGVSQHIIDRYVYIYIYTWDILGYNLGRYCMILYVCLSACMYQYVCTSMYACMSVCLSVCMHVCPYIMYACMSL